MSDTEPNSGLNIFTEFADGDPGWADEMIANFKRIGRVGFHLSVLDRDLTTPPGDPMSGDRYIVGPSATGDWSGQDGNIAVFDGEQSPGAWVFFEPSEGWLVYIADEEVLSVYKPSSDTGNNWSAGVAI